MKHNGKLLALARSELNKKRQANSEEHQRRIGEVYAKVPEISRIDARLQNQMISMAKLLLSGNRAEAERLKDANLSLQMKRVELLVQNGYPKDYLDELYFCPVCRDTGMDGQKNCACIEQLYNSLLTEQLSGLLKTGQESFASFDPSLYPQEKRQYMTDVMDLCREYAQFFPEVDNLLLSGAPGLGKTFLSACIAREIAKRNYSIVYDTASSIFSAFEKKPFARDGEQDETGGRVSSILECDLLILDDLGTEYTTANVMSALYTIINSRVNNRKNTIINTNLSLPELKRRYSGAICSRLEGYFTNLKFEGEDIRQVLARRAEEENHG